MNGKGRKLFRSAVGILTSVMMMGAYTTTAMASGIGVIDAKDMLDIHAEANTASAVIGQVMEDGHVAILAKYNDWVQIQAGEIAGWVPAENLVETEISNEEAVAANEQVIAERTGATASEDEFFAEEEVQQDEEVWWELLEAALRQAAEKFVETRTIEGANLKRDLLGKLDQMAADVTFIEERSPQIIAEYRSKLEEKVKEFLEDSTIEENRIAAEVTLYADKIAVDEEIVRLQSHISSMTDVLESDESIGRKLDFMAQEMNREANTILSKSSDVDLADHAIELKTNVEKVREQIQNIE